MFFLTSLSNLSQEKCYLVGDHTTVVQMGLRGNENVSSIFFFLQVLVNPKTDFYNHVKMRSVSHLIKLRHATLQSLIHLFFKFIIESVITQSIKLTCILTAYGVHVSTTYNKNSK